MTMLAGLEETAVVRTPAFDQIRSAADFVVPRHEMALIYGDHGVGKRTALADYLDNQPLPVTELDLPPTPTSKLVAQRLHSAVLGADEELPERIMQDDLIEALSERPRIVVVHRVHRLTAEAAGQLEYLLCRPTGKAAVFLVGGTNALKAVGRDALLADAIAATVSVERLTGDDLTKALQSMHIMLLGAGNELLTAIDSTACHGLMLNWARFLQHALDLREKAVSKGKVAPVLDLKFARAVMHSLPRTMLAKDAK
jgi:DNA transposition AAA+ family ATPase